MKRASPLLQTLICLAGVAAISGCAATHSAVLRYPPDGQLNSTTMRSAEAHHDTVAVSAFTDARQNRNRIGATQNRYGAEFYDIYAVNDVAAWVDSALIFELARHGYPAVYINQRQADTSYPVISGKVIKAHSTAYNSYEAEVTLSVVVSLRDRILLDKKYSGYGNAGFNMVAEPEEFGRSVSLALADALRRLMADLPSAMVGAIDSPASNPAIALDTAPRISNAFGPSAPEQSSPSGTPSVDSICKLDKKVYIVNGKRTAQSVFNFMKSQDSTMVALQTMRLELNPDVQGDVFVLMKIDETGAVRLAEIALSKIDDNLLETQIVETIKKMNFPKLKGETDLTTCLYKITFYKRNLRGQKVALAIIGSVLSLGVYIFIQCMIVPH